MFASSELTNLEPENYESASFTTLDSVQIGSYEVNMVSGSGGSSSPTPTAVYTNAWVLFQGIKFMNVLSPIDHAALYLEKSSGIGYFYSFAAAMDEAIAAVSEGTQGYLGTAVSMVPSHIVSEKRKEKICACTEAIEKSGKVFLDFIDNADGKEDEGYYRAIKIPISDATGSLLVAHADSFRKACINAIQDDDNSQGTLSDYKGISTTYELFNHNCYDGAADLLKLVGVTIDYDKSSTLVFLTALSSYLVAVAPIAAAAAIIFIAGLTASDDLPNVPNCVYEGFRQANKDGVRINNAYTYPFRDRG